MTRKYIYLLILILSFLSLNLQAQSDCDPELHDPLLDIGEENQPVTECCIVPELEGVCYLVGGALEVILPNNPYLKQIEYPGGVWQYPDELPGQYDTYISDVYDLMLTLNSMFEELGVDIGTSGFELSQDGMSICASITNVNFGRIYFGAESDPPSGQGLYLKHNFITVDKELCIESEPVLGDIMNPSNLNPENYILTDSDGNEVLSTNSLMASIDTSDPTAPPPNVIGQFFNYAMSSGALMNGMNCDMNLNCIDWQSMAESLDVGQMADQINTQAELAENEMGNVPSGNLSWSEYLSQAVAEELEGINVSEMYNDAFGLNWTNYGPCTENPLVAGTGGMGESTEAKGLEKNADSAEFDFLSGTIPGLGESGAMAGDPSPASMKMIADIKAGVNLYNGAQNSSIPLYKFQSNDISVPISISSSNNGLKIDDLGSELGQHWKIDAGGSITRVVKGLPDDFKGIIEAKGIGPKTYMFPHTTIFSGAGLHVDFITPDVACDIPTFIAKDGLHLVKDSPTIDVFWSPTDPTHSSFSLKVPVFDFAGARVSLRMTFKSGYSINTKLAHLYYEEEALGYAYTGSAEEMEAFGVSIETGGLTGALEDYSDADKKKLLEAIHPFRRVDDLSFFSDAYGSWIALRDAVVGTFSKTTFKSKRLDIEPDEYHFSAGGYSGMFIIDNIGQIKMFPEQPGLIITPYYSSATDKTINSFKIRTPSGMEYEFGGGNVDQIENISYSLNNAYTYPELELDRTTFGKAELDVYQFIQKPFIGPKRLVSYNRSWDRNYRITKDPIYNSTWHLHEIKSQLSQEKVELVYEELNDIKYYSNKSFSHTFPNFYLKNGKLKTEENTSLNPLHAIKTKWQNGAANLGYNISETNLKKKYNLSLIKSSILNDRGKQVVFEYDDANSRPDLVGDKLCTSIRVETSDSSDPLLLKGWEFLYDCVEEDVEIVMECDNEIPSGEVMSPTVTFSSDTKYDLGESYVPHWTSYLKYTALEINIECLGFPTKIPNGLFFNFLPKEYVKANLWEKGSIADVKRRSEGFVDFDALSEYQIHTAEHRRVFLCSINELKREGGTGQSEDVISTTINYYNEELISQLPKRFSVDQDLFGYYADNQSGSPLAPLDYEAIGNGGSISSASLGVDKHFPFQNEDHINNMHFGRPIETEYNSAIIGSIKSITMPTGAKITFEYEENELGSSWYDLPNPNVAGLRVKKLIEDPGVGIAKITDYSYSIPTIINKPKYNFQTEHNIYERTSFAEAHNLEEVVTTTSVPQNSLISNKANFIGYGQVSEEWDGAGRKEHYFTTPINYSEHLTNALEIQDGASYGNGYRHRMARDGMNDYSFLSTNNPAGMPPSSDVDQIWNFWTWMLGVKYKDEIYNNDNELEQTVNSNYEMVCSVPYGSGGGNGGGDLGGNGSEQKSKVTEGCLGLTFFKTSAYEYHYNGSWDQKLGGYLLKDVIAPYGFYALEIPNYWFMISELISDPLFPHLFKQIHRNYLTTDFHIQSGFLRATSSSLVENFEGDTRTTNTSYIYPELDAQNQPLYGEINIPKQVHTGYYIGANSDGTSQTLINIFPEEEEDVSILPLNVKDKLNWSNYKQPIYSQSLQNGTLIQENITVLDLQYAGDGQRVIPVANYALMNGERKFVGEFSDHNADGLPGEYRTMRFNPTDASSSGEVINTIILDWNTRLQPTSRGVDANNNGDTDFETTVGYNDFYDVRYKKDLNDIYTTFEYDDRGRLITVNARQFSNDGGETFSNPKTVSEYTYNIASSSNGENSVETILSFPFPEEGVDPVPDQGSTQYLDGFGKGLYVERNDGTLMGSVSYDALFRPIANYTIGKGVTTTTYPASLLARTITTTDAVGNETTNIQTTGSSAFAIATVIDPNGHSTVNYTSGIGRLKTMEQGEGDQTTYNYDGLGRLLQITNPIGENYEYRYNGFDQMVLKNVPGSESETMIYDRNYRLAASTDGNGNTNFFKYDQLGRITDVYLEEGASIPQNEHGVVLVDTDISDHFIEQNTILNNQYSQENTWLNSTSEKIYSESLNNAEKNSTFFRDEYGRVTGSNVGYAGMDYGAFLTSTLNDADMVVTSSNSVFYPGGTAAVASSYSFGYDDLLRPIDTEMTINNETQLLSRLVYNDQDQVSAKLLGETATDSEAFLQKVDYLYDASGRLTHINTPAQTECWREEVCTFQLNKTIDISGGDIGSDCRFLTSILINGNLYDFPNIGIDLVNAGTAVEDAIEEALDAMGFYGTVIHEDVETPEVIEITLTIENTNASSIVLNFANCQKFGEFERIDCCTPNVTNTDGGTINYTNSDDLYFQEMTFEGIDISRIELSSDCTTGRMRNDYEYDANHRIIAMNNRLINNGNIIEDAYSSTYSYDPAGNIRSLTRNGLISMNQGVPLYGQIDRLEYEYVVNGASSILKQVSDGVSGIAQPKGFAPTVSNYTYDDNGNIESDDGKGIGNIVYNAFDLPQLVEHDEGGQIEYDYTSGGEKVRKVTTGDGGNDEERVYFGGVEFKGDVPEFISHGDGRILLDYDGMNLQETRFQYNITDHLGNSVVTFEDVNDNGIVADAESGEVVQRNTYYPFGLAQEGTWNAATDPEMNYLYNGKELENDLGLGWSFYGFRMCDHSIGRFTGVDPIADQYAFVNPFNYAENKPINGIDLWGLQHVDAFTGQTGPIDPNSTTNPITDDGSGPPGSYLPTVTVTANASETTPNSLPSTGVATKNDDNVTFTDHGTLFNQVGLGVSIYSLNMKSPLSTLSSYDIYSGYAIANNGRVASFSETATRFAGFNKNWTPTYLSYSTFSSASLSRMGSSTFVGALGNKIGTLSLISTAIEWQQGTITTRQAVAEGIVTGAGMAYPSLEVTAFTFGWEWGRLTVSREFYQRAVHPDKYLPSELLEINPPLFSRAPHK